MSIRNAVIAEGPPAGRCEGASGDLAEALLAAGADPSVAWGEYLRPDGEGHPTTGHCWVIVDGLIADPTREQFDDGPLVCDVNGPDARRYRLHHSIRRANIDEE